MATRTLEKRITPDANLRLEVRTQEDGKIGLHGYAAVFDVEAYDEVIRSSAFNRTLQQADNVRLLINHEGVPLASTRAGTMTLATDSIGLWFDAADLDPKNPRVQEITSAVERGDINQCSFAGYFLDAPKESGLREVRECQLIDVSVVTFPWYESTSVSLKAALRSLPGAGPSQTERRHLLQTALLLRAAPAGLESWGDQIEDVWDALEAGVGDYCCICDIGDTWVVYCTWADMETMYLADWSEAADGTVTVNLPGQTVEMIYTPTTETETEPAAPAEEPSAEMMGMPLTLALALASRHAA